MTEPMFKKKAGHLSYLTRDVFRLRTTRLMAQLTSEIGANNHSMESGLPLEDFFRAEMAKALWDPFELSAGQIVDGDGYTCGDCDCVIVNRHMAAVLRPPATPSSRRQHLSNDTTYGIIEVKQTLTLGATDGDTLIAKPRGSLYDACQKIAAYKELNRYPNSDQTHPLGIAFFYRSETDCTQESNADVLLREFDVICAAIPIRLRPDALYVLNSASVFWCAKRTPTPNDKGTLALLARQAVEGGDQPATLAVVGTGEDTLYKMFTHVWFALRAMKLSGPDFLNQYGGPEHSFWPEVARRERK